jgi:Kef-type K+ transport system membrane component KefB
VPTWPLGVGEAETTENSGARLPTLFVTQNFLEDMALVMCVAALATVICQFLHQPLVVVAGMVVGPKVPPAYANPKRVRLVAELGITLLVFSIGLEFNFGRLMRARLHLKQ